MKIRILALSLLLTALVFSGCSTEQESVSANHSEDVSKTYVSWVREVAHRERTEFSGHIYDKIATPSYSKLITFGDATLAHVEPYLLDPKDNMSLYCGILVADILEIEWHKMEPGDLASIRSRVVERFKASEPK